MSYFAIQYDLSHAKEVDYQRLWDEMDRLGAAKYQESAYFLEAAETTKAVLDHLKSFVHKEDLVMVIRFAERPRYTYSKTPGHDWINQRFP